MASGPAYGHDGLNTALVNRKGRWSRLNWRTRAGIGIAVVIWASPAFAGYESARKLLGYGSASHVLLGIAGAGSPA